MEESDQFDELVGEKVMPFVEAQFDPRNLNHVLLKVRYDENFVVSWDMISVSQGDNIKLFDAPSAYKVALVMLQVHKDIEARFIYEDIKSRGWFNEHPEEEISFTGNREFMKTYNREGEGRCILM